MHLIEYCLTCSLVVGFLLSDHKTLIAFVYSKRLFLNSFFSQALLGGGGGDP